MANRKLNMPDQERIFTISGDNKGLACPFKPIVCQEGNCHQCPVYLDWQELEEILVICAWCGEVMRRNPNPGRSVVSHGICPKCQRKHFPEDLEVKVTLEDKVELILMSFEDHLKEHGRGNWSATEWANRFIKAFEEEAQK